MGVRNLIKPTGEILVDSEIMGAIAYSLFQELQSYMHLSLALMITVSAAELIYGVLIFITQQKKIN